MHRRVIFTTTAYTIKDGKVLFLKRKDNSSKQDRGLYLGLGGKFKLKETKQECFIREYIEESGLTPIKYREIGEIYYPNFTVDSDIYMYLYLVEDYSGELSKTTEGEHEWVDIKDIYGLTVWEGDKLFFKYLTENRKHFYSIMWYRNSRIIDSFIIEGDIMVKINIKKLGTIKLELYPDKAPETVANFLKLAKEGFYNGLIFHRVIKGFMIQGGCPDGTGMGGPGYTIKGEFTQNGFKNDLKHERGVISMARTMDPNSAGSQFFIMHKDSPHLDGSYASFGRVVDGIEVVDKIANSKTDFRDRPLEDVVIDSIEVE